MIKLRFFGDAGMPTDFENYMDASVLNKYKVPVVITKGDDYTHAILFNTCQPALTIPKKNVVGISHEPNFILFHNVNKLSFIEYAKKHIGKYVICDKGDLPDPFVEGQQFLLHNHRSSIPPTICKTRFCSFIISNKKYMPGHKYRHELVQAILKTDLPIDIYGRGSHIYQTGNDSRIKGAFEQTKEACHGVVPYAEYKYSICIENSISNHYFSEKIINPMMYNTVPIYIGCKQMDQYLKPTIKLSGSVTADIHLLHRLFQSKNVPSLPDAKDVLDKVNLFHHLDQLFSDAILL
jgi:hypothetical protein